MMTICQLKPWEQTSVKLQSKYKLYFHGNAFENVVNKVGPFCSGRNMLIHCGLVTPYGDIDLGQH